MKATRVIRDTNLRPEETVRAATELAYQFAPDAPLRALSSRILGSCQNVLRDGPRIIAEWVKENIQYRQESPGIEYLQGPYTTIPYGVKVGDFEFTGTGVGDCDDLVILWACLCRASGIDAFVAALAAFPYRNTGFVHALGYSASNGKFYELSEDEAYGGVPGKPLVLDAPPVGFSAYYWSPQRGGFVVLTNDPHAPLPSYDMGGGPMYDPRRLDKNMGATGKLTLPKIPKIPKDVALSQKSAGMKSPRLSEFDGSLPLDTSGSPQPGDPNFMEAFEQSFHDANQWFSNEFGVNISDEFGITPSEAIQTLQEGLVKVGEEAAGPEGARNTAMLLSGATAFLTNPTPVTAALGIIVGLGVLVRGLMHQGKYKRKYTRINEDIKDVSQDLCRLCLPADFERTERGAIQEIAMKVRMMELIPILQGEAGRVRHKFRSQVRVPLLANQISRDGGYAMLRSGFSRDERMEITRRSQEWGVGRFLDGTTDVKGMEFVGTNNNRGTAASMAISRDGYRLTLQLVRAISAGVTEGEGQARKDLALSTFWSLLAQVLRIRVDGSPIQTIAQRRTSVGTGRGLRALFTGGQDARQIAEAAIGNTWGGQKPTFITYDRFWQGVDENGNSLPTGAFNRVWGKTIVDMVRPCERAFGAVEGTFDDGGLFEHLQALGLQNYRALQPGFEAAYGTVELTPDPAGPPPPPVEEEGGSNAPLIIGLGLGAGALALLLGGG